MRRLWRQLQTRLFSPPTPPSYEGRMNDMPYGGVDDGVDYSQPVIIPGWLRRLAATNTKLSESLTTPQNLSQTYRDQFSNPNRTGYDLPIMQTTEDPLMEWDWSTRERVLSNCHAAYARNPVANAAVDYTADFVVGDGFNLTCKNPEVEEILEAFINNPENAIRETERQAVIDLQVDGELIIRYFTEAGEVIAVPQRPWELESIKTEIGFFRRPETYRFQRRETEGDSPSGTTKTMLEDVDAKDVQFVAINRHRYELRGRPELYRILPWLRADKEFLEDRVRQNKWRGALLWWVSVINGTAPTIANVAARWRKPPSPGSAYVSSDKEVVQPLSNPTQADDASLDGRAIRLMILIGVRLPEYFFADGANANLASSTNQSLPALTKFEAFQQIMIEQVWTPMFKRVLQVAIDAGELPEEVEEYDSTGKPKMEDATPEEYQGQADEEYKADKALQQEGRNLLTSPDLSFIARSVLEEFGIKSNNKTPITPPSEVPTLPDIAKQMSSGQVPPPTEIPPQKPKTCKTIDAFEVSYEPVKSQDLAALTNMLSTATDRGWASNQTAAEKLGFDTAIEKERGEREANEQRTKVAQGLVAPPEDMANMMAANADRELMKAKMAANGKP